MQLLLKFESRHDPDSVGVSGSIKQRGTRSNEFHSSLSREFGNENYINGFQERNWGFQEDKRNNFRKDRDGVNSRDDSGNLNGNRGHFRDDSRGYDKNRQSFSNWSSRYRGTVKIGIAPSRWKYLNLVECNEGRSQEWRQCRRILHT